jgi:hypothetical protein
MILEEISMIYGILILQGHRILKLQSISYKNQDSAIDLEKKLVSVPNDLISHLSQKTT